VNAVEKYRLRLRRRYLMARAFRRRRQLTSVTQQTSAIKSRDLLCFSTLRNEYIRLPYFLEYYRDRGVNHFLMVDNDSTDGSREYLAEQPDVSLWTTSHSYRDSRFGVDWLNWLQMRYGSGHWTLTIDVDEFLVYPFCDTRPINGLTDWLDTAEISSMSAMLLDMYPKGPVDAQPYQSGQDPMEIACWFDSGNYMISKNSRFGNLWIQGGPRARAFFPNDPNSAPALNKTPLIKWNWRYAYESSTHIALPRQLNRVYDEWGGEKISGVLLHTKFLDTFSVKATEEMARQQHYAGSREYRAYSDGIGDGLDLWCNFSEKYINWRQLEILGLMSKGNWA
jgi:hypothetical protein